MEIKMKILMFLIIVIMLVYSALKNDDENTKNFKKYTYKENQCNLIETKRDIFWTDIIIGCKDITPPNEMFNYSLRWISTAEKYEKYRIFNDTRLIACLDTTTNLYSSCNKIYSYRKYF